MFKKAFLIMIVMLIPVLSALSVFAETPSPSPSGYVDVDVTMESADLREILEANTANVSFYSGYDYIDEEFTEVHVVTPTYVSSDTYGVVYRIPVSSYDLTEGYSIQYRCPVANITGKNFEIKIGVGTDGGYYNDHTLRANFNYNGLTDSTGTVTYGSIEDIIRYDYIVHTHSDEGSLLSFNMTQNNFRGLPNPNNSASYVYIRFWYVKYTTSQYQGATLDDIYQELTDQQLNERTQTLDLSQMQALIAMGTLQYHEVWNDMNQAMVAVQTTGTIPLSNSYFIGTDRSGLMYYKVPRSVIGVSDPSYRCMSLTYTIQFPVNVMSNKFEVVFGQMADDIDSQMATQTLTAYDQNNVRISYSDNMNYASFVNPTGKSEPFFYSYLDIYTEYMINYSKLSYSFSSLTGMKLDSNYIYFFISPITYSSTVEQNVNGTLSELAEQMGLLMGEDYERSLYYKSLIQGDNEDSLRVKAIMEKLDLKAAQSDLEEILDIDQVQAASQYVDQMGAFLDNSFIVLLCVISITLGIGSFVLFGRH